MQHFYAQEIEADHRHREFERQIEANAQVLLTGSRSRMNQSVWHRCVIARWRLLASFRPVFALLLLAPLVTSKRHA
jgi:hypothetical protein